MVMEIDVSAGELHANQSVVLAVLADWGHGRERRA